MHENSLIKNVETISIILGLILKIMGKLQHHFLSRLTPEIHQHANKSMQVISLVIYLYLPVTIAGMPHAYL
jgi:hypothetical protein